MQSIFALLRFQRNLILFLRYKTLCKTEKTMWISFILLESCLLVNEWCLVDCFHREFRVSTQIMVRDYCIAKCKKFSFCGGLLMVLQAIFLWFKIFALVTILQEYGKLKVWIPPQVYFKDFIHKYRTAFYGFGTTYLKNGFLWSCFSKILSGDFWIATKSKTGLSKKYSWKILFIDSKISTTKITHLRVN